MWNSVMIDEFCIVHLNQMSKTHAALYPSYNCDRVSLATMHFGLFDCWTILYSISSIREYSSSKQPLHGVSYLTDQYLRTISNPFSLGFPISLFREFEFGVAMSINRMNCDQWIPSSHVGHRTWKIFGGLLGSLTNGDKDRKSIWQTLCRWCLIHSGARISGCPPIMHRWWSIREPCASINELSEWRHSGYHGKI